MYLAVGASAGAWGTGTFMLIMVGELHEIGGVGQIGDCGQCKTCASREMT
jgi:hypothetical protein